MRSSIPRIGEITLVVLALVLLVALALPWRQPDSEEALLTGSAEPSPDSEGSVSEPVLASPAVLYDLFIPKGSGAAEPPPAPPPAEKKPAPAPWLRYIGTISGAEGTTYHFFKDTRSGRSIALSAGETVNGWSLVEASDTAFILSDNDDLYFVNKR